MQIFANVLDNISHELEKQDVELELDVYELQSTLQFPDAVTIAPRFAPMSLWV